MNPFLLSLEMLDGTVRRHGFHLGTDEGVARRIVEEAWSARRDLRSLALLRDGRLFDVFDGSWSSDQE